MASRAEVDTGRRTRLGIAAGVSLLAAALVAVAVALAAGGGASGLQSARTAQTTYRQVSRLLAGIPQHGVTLGSPDAPVTMTYYGDLECPVCQAFTEQVLPGFIAQDVRAGKVKITYRSLMTASALVNRSRFDPQQVAAYAAGRQDLFWQYAELFYREQGSEDDHYVTESYLRALAAQIPSLKRTTWLSDRQDPALLAQVQNDQRVADAQGVPDETPEVTMSGPRGITGLPADSFPTITWLQDAVGQVA